MREVLFVSKPVSPPWNDGSKVLVRDLAPAVEGFRATVLASHPGSLGGAIREGGYGSRGYAPGLRDNARVLRRLLLGQRPDLLHYVFMPNPRSAAAGRLVSLRGVPSVQTVTSAPARFDPRLLFADHNVVLSQNTERRFLAAGVPPDRISHIPAPVAEVAPPRSDPFGLLGLEPQLPVITFAGDLEPGSGVETVVAAAHRSAHDAVWVFACRRKSSAAAAVEERLRRETRSLRVRFLGETAHIHALLAATTVMVFPATCLVGKTDLPMVLLEALSLGRAAIVSDVGPLAELAHAGACLAVPPTGPELAAAVDRLLTDPSERVRWSEGGQRYYRAHHEPRAVAQRYERVYEAVLER